MDIERLTRLLQYQQQDPTNLSLCIDIGFLQLSLKQFVSAKESALKAINLVPDNCSGYTLHGLVSISEGEFEIAAHMFDQAFARGETAPSAFYNHAYALSRLEKFTEAEAPAAQAAQHISDFPHAPALYIRVLHYLGKVEEAIKFAESLPTDTVVPGVNGMLSTLYIDAENHEKARSTATAALNENTADTDARTTLGLLALQELNASEAEAEFDRVLELHGNQGRAMLGKGLSALLGGDLPKATMLLEQTLAQTNMNTHIGTWHTLAWCHILQKNIPAAEQAFKTSLEFDRNFAETHGGLAVIALMRGNIDSAIQSAKRAQGLDKNNFSGNFAQSLIQQVSGNASQAAVIMDKILNQSILPDGRSIQSLLIERMVKGDKSRPENKTLH